MRLLARLLALLAIWRRSVRGRRAGDLPPPAAPEPDVAERRVMANRRAETLVATLLIGASACAIAFVVLYVVVSDDTQLLGLAAGLALACLAAALMIASFRVVPQETTTEPRPQLDRPEEEGEVAEQARAGLEGVSRRKLLAGAGGAAGAALTAAAVAPLASLGPRVDHRLGESPWRSGRLLVDEEDKPVRAADVNDGAFVTAFPEGADKRELGSPVVVVRTDPAKLDLPAGRAGWAPQGLLAFSKICTHAGCAIALYRKPLYEPTSTYPALVCPCHYSTFDVRRAAQVTFGPAGRPLPQLPLTIDAEGMLRAGGPMSGPVGPAWWGSST